MLTKSLSAIAGNQIVSGRRTCHGERLATKVLGPILGLPLAMQVRICRDVVLGTVDMRCVPQLAESFSQRSFQPILAVPASPIRPLPNEKSTPGGVRTHNLCLRRAARYPIVPRARNALNYLS